MNKLYSRLHNANNNFRKHLLSISLLLFLTLVIGTNANAQCDVNPVANQTVCNNIATTAINFTGTATTFNWINNTPSIGLAASGTGNIASFTALNPSATAVTATITVTPSAGACTGTPINFTITVNPSPVVNVTPSASCGGDPGGNGPCNLLTASGADTYAWSPLAGLYTNCTHTVPYTGGNTPTVYAAPTSYTVYTVTGTITATGCSTTATARVNYTPTAPIVTPNPAVLCLGDPAVKLKVISGLATAQFCSGPVNIVVPDNNPAGTSNSITVSGIPAACGATGMFVSINMPHGRIGDMVFVLRAPNGFVMNLDYHLTATGSTGPTTGFVNTVMSSTGIAALSTGTNPYTGTFRADFQLTPAGGFGAAGPTGMQPTVGSWFSLLSVPNGTWTLGFYDGVSGNVGTLTSWCLGINYTCPGGLPANPAVWSPIVGLFYDPAATIPYVGTPTDSVWARPTPAGTYTYSVTTQSLPGPLASFSNPAAISIPVGGVASPYSSNIAVSGLPTTGARIRSVVLNGVNHTRSSDIDVLLQSPTGQNVILMSDVGGANAINGTYTFIDWRAFMSSTFANPPGTYCPTNSGQPDNFPAPGPGTVSAGTSTALGTFTGNMNGTWKLFVVDDDGSGDQGIISGGYTINFDTVALCTSPPRSVVVTVGQFATITTQPVNQTVCIGNSASFSVVVTGTGPFTYQWQLSSNGGTSYNNIVNGGVFGGALTNTLLVNAPPVTMNGNLFRVIINGGSGCSGAISSVALLTVNPVPNVVISANPIIIAPGQETIIRSTVTPNPATTYTWYLDGVIVPGATADTIVVDINSLGAYQLSVTDVNGCSNLSNIITIAHAFTTNLFVYPNPSTGRFQVRSYSAANNILPRSLVVYNNKGDMILTRNYTQTSPYQKIEIDLRPYGKGIYWVENRDQNGKRININRVVIQ